MHDADRVEQEGKVGMLLAHQGAGQAQDRAEVSRGRGGGSGIDGFSPEQELGIHRDAQLHGEIPDLP